MLCIWSRKKICSVLTKEKVDCSTKKIFFVKIVAKFVHKILLKKLGFVFYGIMETDLFLV